MTRPRANRILRLTPAPPADAAAAQAEQADRCRALWAAILKAGLEDATKGDREARRWLRSPDFATVCDLSDVDPHATRRAFVAADTTTHHRSRGGRKCRT